MMTTTMTMMVVVVAMTINNDDDDDMPTLDFRFGLMFLLSSFGLVVQPTTVSTFVVNLPVVASQLSSEVD